MNQLLDKIKGILSSKVEEEVLSGDAPELTDEFLDSILGEAYALSKAKELMKMYDKTRYNVWFKGKDRIALTPINQSRIETEDTAAIVPVKVHRVLKRMGYEVTDYIGGYCKRIGTASKNVQSIGGILNAVPKSGETEKEAIERKEAAKIFQMDTARESGAKKDDFLVVISRAPYDIGGASTGRSWSSCMNLGYVSTKCTPEKASAGYSHVNRAEWQAAKDAGKKFVRSETAMNASYIYKDIKYGTLVAYWIKKKAWDDFYNKKSGVDPLNAPLGRFFMKPYWNERGEPLLICDDKMYPKGAERIPGFQETVKRWLDSVQGPAHGTFKQLGTRTGDPDSLYNDHMPDTYTRKDPSQNHTNFTLKDGLTWEIVMSRYSWLAEAHVTKAVVGLNRDQNIIWYSGRMQQGTFKNGEWRGGEFMQSSFISGVWKGGVFDTSSVWVDGEMTGGKMLANWTRGIMRGGEFKGSSFAGEVYDGKISDSTTFVDGIVYGGQFYGTFKKGVFKGGEFFGRWRPSAPADAIWEGGSWKTNEGFPGEWKSGQFAGPMFTGTFNGGSFRGREMRGAAFKRGVFESGYAKDTVFESGTVLKGVFENCTFKGNVVVKNAICRGCTGLSNAKINAVWYGGVFRGATFVGGDWMGGTWESGTWKGGRWTAGTNPPPQAKTPTIDIEAVKKIVAQMPYPSKEDDKPAAWKSGVEKVAPGMPSSIAPAKRRYRRRLP